MTKVKIFQAGKKEELETQVNAFLENLEEAELHYDMVLKPREDQFDITSVYYSCLIKYKE